MVFKEDVHDGRSKNLKGKQVLSMDQLKEVADGYGAKVTHGYTDIISGLAVEMPEEDAKKLADHPLVSYVEPQVMSYPIQTPDWGIDRIDQRELPLDGEFNPRNSGSHVTSYIILEFAFLIKSLKAVPNGVLISLMTMILTVMGMEHM